VVPLVVTPESPFNLGVLPHHLLRAALHRSDLVYRYYEWPTLPASYFTRSSCSRFLHLPVSHPMSCWRWRSSGSCRAARLHRPVHARRDGDQLRGAPFTLFALQYNTARPTTSRDPVFTTGILALSTAAPL